MIFNKFYERVKNNAMVKSSVEVFHIAKEVYSLVNEQEMDDSEKTFKSVEDVYVSAAQKVTGYSEKKVKARLDYRIVHNGAQIYRKARSTARSTNKIIKKKYNKTKSYISTHFKNIKTMTTRNYSEYKEKLLESRFMRSERVQNLKTYLYNCQNKIYALAKEIYNQLDSFVGFQECKQYSKKLSADIICYLNSARNKVIDGKNTLVDVASNNFSSASKIAIYNYEFIKQIMKADVDAMLVAMDTNKKLLLAYLNDLELEMYYSPDQAIRVIETIKHFANGILQNHASDTVSNSSAQPQGEISTTRNENVPVVRA